MAELPHVPALFAAADKHRALLAAGEREVSRGMLRMYAAAWTNVRAELDALEAAMEAHLATGGSLGPRWLAQQNRLQGLEAAILEHVGDVATRSAAAVKVEQGKTVQAAIARAQQLIGTGLGPEPPGLLSTFGQLTPGVEDLAGFLADGSPLLDLFDEIAPQLARAARREMLVGTVGGLSPKAIAARIRAHAGGSLARLLTIARTEILRANREGTRRTYAANPDVVKGWLWHCARDRRTCSSCWAMHGSFHHLDERLDDHPNGRCAMLPVTRTWAEMGVKGLEAAETTPIPTGPEIFAELPEADQRRILGPKKLALYQAGALELPDVVQRTSSAKFGTMRREATIAEALANADKRVAKAAIAAKAAKADTAAAIASRAQLAEVAAAKSDVAKLKHLAATLTDPKAKLAAATKLEAKQQANKLSSQAHAAKVKEAKASTAAAAIAAAKAKAEAEAKVYLAGLKLKAEAELAAAKAQLAGTFSNVAAKKASKAAHLLQRGQTAATEINAATAAKGDVAKLKQLIATAGTEKGQAHAQNLLTIKQAANKAASQAHAAKVKGAPKVPKATPAEKAAIGAATKPVVPHAVPPSVPRGTPLAPRPLPFDPTTLKPNALESANLGGAHKKQVYTAPDGSLWLHKPQDRHRAELDAAIGRIAHRAGFEHTTTDVFIATVDGKLGSLQRMVGTAETRRAAFGKYGAAFDATKLNAGDAAQLQRHAAFDWMIGNHDGHAAQFVKLKGGGGAIHGVDKGQAFKFFHQDRLDHAYKPNAAFNVNSVYNEMHLAYAQGKAIPIESLAKGGNASLRAFIGKLQAVPDADYREMLRGYAETAHARGELAGGKVSVDGFLAAAVKRKQTLLADFEAYHARLDDLRPKPAKPRPNAAGALEFTDNQAGHNWARTAWRQGGGGLTPDEVAAVGRYKGSGYTAINNRLRAPGLAPTPTIKAIDSALEKQPLAQDTMVVRAVDWNALRPGTNASNVARMQGEGYTDPGYMSSSIGATPGYHSEYPVWMRIRANAGTPAYYVENLHGHGGGSGGEREILLARGSTFDVTGVHREHIPGHGEKVILDMTRRQTDDDVRRAVAS